MAARSDRRVNPASLQTVDDCRVLLRRSLGLIERFRGLIEAHGNDITFLTDGHFSLVPESWGSLEALSAAELTRLPLGALPENSTAELRDFVEECMACQLDPYPLDQPVPGACHVRHFLGTTEKKRDEMIRMAHLIAGVCEECKVPHVVDIGCGKGYLSTLLAATHGLAVLGIEQSEETAAAANERNESVRKKLPKAGGQDVFDLKVRAARVKLRENAGGVSLESILEAEHVATTVLVGLHICGDLLPDCCQLFASCPRIAALVVCGCCYNMLSEAAEPGDCDGELGSKRSCVDEAAREAAFPLSLFATELGAFFGRRLRNAACNSVFEWAGHVSAWVDRVVYTSGYRAVLGAFMAMHGLSTTTKWGKTFQNVKRKPLFGAWAHELLGRHCAGAALHSADTLQAFYDARHGRCDAQLLAFEAVAGLLLPVLETFIVVDRLLFLCERGCPVQLRALFDPALSPRNWVLVAQRPLASS
jgi:SAM-dependent methyltransferase